jgi:predicted nuclease with RNAse H fold
VSLAAGIDVSARRGLHVALLEDGRRLLAVAHVADAAAAVAWLADHAADAPVGMDAPLGPRLPLLQDAVTRALVAPPPPDGRYRRFRVCDYQLARRGIGLYLSPLLGEQPPSWMSAGYTLAAALLATGRRAPRHPEDHAATLLEVYPYAAFVALLGGIPPRKTTSTGRAARLLALAGIAGLEAADSHDFLDAVAAAYTVAEFTAGRGCAVGDAREGLIILPIMEAGLLARYRRLGE